MLCYFLKKPSLKKREKKTVRIEISYYNEDSLKLWAIASFIDKCCKENNAVPADAIIEFFNGISFPLLEQMETFSNEERDKIKVTEEKAIARFTADKNYRFVGNELLAKMIKSICDKILSNVLKSWNEVSKGERKKWLCKIAVEETLIEISQQKQLIREGFSQYKVNTIAGFIVNNYKFKLTNSTNPTNSALGDTLYKIVPNFEEIKRKHFESSSISEIEPWENNGTITSEPPSKRKSSRKIIDPFNDNL